MIWDVLVVGAGPGGSSIANLLARRGISTLLLDKSEFPRDKVCGDGLTPQAVYWLDRLGCADEVLAETNACIKACDLYINGAHVLTGGFPANSVYPDFAILLDRRRFDHILLCHALARGASFKGGRIVRAVEQGTDCAVVVASAGGQQERHRARIVIGADGVASAVSRSIGNTLKDGPTAVSLRTYFRGVRCKGSQIKVYFDRDYFPGYGWLFVDDGGFANVGLGYAYDRGFRMIDGLGDIFRTFLETDLGEMLADAERCGPVAGGSASFYRPKAIVGDRVLLIGDAANQADPLNGGGIHKAMESAFCAAEAVDLALSIGDTSRAALGLYETLWSRNFELDWRTAEIFLSVAKNPDLKEFCLYLLTQIGRMTSEDKQFQDFCSGVFSGVISQSILLSPRALYHAFPKDGSAWFAVLDHGQGTIAGGVRLTAGAVASLARSAAAMARRPLTSLDWGIDVATKLTRLAERQTATLAEDIAPVAWPLAPAGQTRRKE